MFRNYKTNPCSVVKHITIFTLPECHPFTITIEPNLYYTYSTTPTARLESASPSSSGAAEILTKNTINNKINSEHWLRNNQIHKNVCYPQTIKEFYK